LAHIGRIGDDIAIADEQALGLLRRLLGDADRGAFRQPHLEEQLAARRGREELLLHETEAGDRGDEHQHRGGDDAAAPGEREFDGAAQCAIDARVVDRIRIVVRSRLGQIGQQLEAEVRREQHRHDP
jgi:hypothetical protein